MRPTTEESEEGGGGARSGVGGVTWHVGVANILRLVTADNKIIRLTKTGKIIINNKRIYIINNYD